MGHYCRSRTVQGPRRWHLGVELGAQRGRARAESWSDTRALPVGGLRVMLLSGGRGSWVWQRLPSACGRLGLHLDVPQGSDPSRSVVYDVHQSEHFTDTISNHLGFPQSLNRHQFDSQCLALVLSTVDIAMNERIKNLLEFLS